MTLSWHLAENFHGEICVLNARRGIVLHGCPDPDVRLIRSIYV